MAKSVRPGDRATSRPLPVMEAAAPTVAPLRTRDTEPADVRAAGSRFVVEGLCCAAEARQIEGKLGGRPDVSSLRIDPVNHTIDVGGAITRAQVERAVADLGMRARPVGEPEPERSWWDRRGRLVLAVVAGVLWLGSIAAGRWLESQAVAAVFAIGAVASGGRHVFPRGVAAIRNRSLDMNFLMAVAAVGALLIGEYAEAASVMFLFAVAQLLEVASMDRARRAIRSLMELAPSMATVVREGAEVRVPAGTVLIGELVIVRPGEKIAVDGVIDTGRSFVDQAAITGESVPVSKEPGEEVFAGTINGEGVLEVRSSRSPSDTTLARIIHSVEEAQASRAPSQTFVDRFARVYTPVVVGTAAAVALVPPLVAGAPWGEWVYRALALLVVACPCALVISTPVTVVSALTGAARRGILIKGGLHLENAGRARVIAFDKTGTLTEGRPEVMDVRPFGGEDASRVLALAAAVESRSDHPLAGAIRTRAAAEGLALPAVTEARALPGRGAEATIGGRRVLVGNERLFREEGDIAPEAAGAIHDMERSGRTVVLVGVQVTDPSIDPVQASASGNGGSEMRVVGAIALADRVRREAIDAVRSLRDSGIAEIAMLTGDNAATADAVGSMFGGTVTQVRAALLPADKVSAVRSLRDAHGPVLMVGDGINDAPALAAADVGIAMGAAGTDVALETADIALMADDLGGLAVMVRMARKAERIIRGNIAFALAVKAVFVVLAVTGLATLWMAVLADMGASLVVIANGMRALRATA